MKALRQLRCGMEIVEPARVEERAEIPYVGIRVITPFRGMLAARDRLLAEARTGVTEAGIETIGYGLNPDFEIDSSIRFFARHLGSQGAAI